MQIASRQFADTTVAALSGSLDHASAVAFEAAVMPLLAQVGTAKGSLVLDFAGVDYISSVGLRVLMIASKQVRAQQTQLIVAAPQSVVAEIFTISRFNKVLTLTASLPDALALCSPAAQSEFAAFTAQGGA